MMEILVRGGRAQRKFGNIGRPNNIHHRNPHRMDEFGSSHVSLQLTRDLLRHPPQPLPYVPRASERQMFHYYQENNCHYHHTYHFK